jgi:hypothetical protein
MPFTIQVTAVFDEFATIAVNVTRWLTGKLAEPGATVTITLLTIVAIAVTDCGGFVSLLARSVTGFVRGILEGAV